MTADAQARGVEEEAKAAAEKERFILEAAGMNVVSAINHGFTYEHGYLAGYRAAEEKAAKETRTAVVEELSALAKLECHFCRKGWPFESHPRDPGNHFHLDDTGDLARLRDCEASWELIERIAELEAQAAEPETGGER